MSVLNVLTYPDPVLKLIAATVDNFDERLLKLIQDMYDTLEVNRGVGLAAPQVGILEKIVVIKYEKRKLALINPEIVSREGTIVDIERCLSCPGQAVEMTRSEKITIKAKNKSGKEITLKEKGYIARIMQHEIDHLSGKLIADQNRGF